MKIFAKVALPVVLFLLLSLFAIMFFAYWSLRQELFQELFLERKDDVVRNAQVLLSEDLFREDSLSDDTHARLESFMKSLRAADVIRLTVWDMHGRVLDSDLKPIIGKEAIRHEELFSVYESRHALFVTKEHDLNDPLQSSVSPLYVILVPLIFDGRMVAVVEMHFSNALIGSLIDRNVFFIGGLLFMTAVFSIGAILFVIRRFVVNPLQEISEVSERMRAGDFGTSIRVEGRDEIGRLASEFEHMRVSLKDMVGELQKKEELAKKAEEEVRERMIEAEQLNEVMIGRELRMIELKEKLKQCEARFGEGGGVEKSNGIV